MARSATPGSSHASGISRRHILQGAIAVGALRYGHADAAQSAASPEQNSQMSKPMTSYIGTPTSRVDGRAKVTGAAKYAGEFSAPDLVHAAIVASTIAKGRIISIDISQAMEIDGVIAVLTHTNRPAMADNDKAYKDDVAPDVGSPFRPLYDDRIMFSGQPVALVIAEDWETARYAASLVRVKYSAE